MMAQEGRILTIARLEETLRDVGIADKVNAQTIISWFSRKDAEQHAYMNTALCLLSHSASRGDVERLAGAVIDCYNFCAVGAVMV